MWRRPRDPELRSYIDAVHDAHVKLARRVEMLEKRNTGLEGRVKHLERRLMKLDGEPLPPKD